MAAGSPRALSEETDVLGRGHLLWEVRDCQKFLATPVKIYSPHNIPSQGSGNADFPEPRVAVPSIARRKFSLGAAPENLSGTRTPVRHPHRWLCFLLYQLSQVCSAFVGCLRIVWVLRRQEAGFLLCLLAPPLSPRCLGDLPASTV